MQEVVEAGAVRLLPENTGAKAALVVWADIPAADEPGFNEWYNREHMRDRVCELPGFIRGRRYAIVDGAPKYFALYDVADSAVFTREEYVSLVSAPDPSSAYYIPRFQDAYRTISRIDFAYGEGEGAALALWVLDPEADAASIESVRSAVRDTLLMPGTVAAQLLSRDDAALAASARRHVRQNNRTLERALVLEAMDMQHLVEAAASLSSRLGTAAGAPSMFQLLYRVSR